MEWIEKWKKQFHHKVNTIDLKCGINTGETLVGKLSTLKEINLQHLAQLLTLPVD
jgi:hypothetical protein